MITESSRYVDSEFLWAPARGVSKYSAFLNTITVLTAPYIVHISRDGDTLHIIAAIYYGKAERWWIVADANPQVFSPLHIIPGTPIRIPQ